MYPSKLAIATTLAALLSLGSVAQADPVAVSGPALGIGVTVYDPQGAEVGKIDSASGDTVVLDTGTNKATLPKNVFGTSPKGPTVNATRTQIDTMVAAASAKSNAAFDAALVPGAEVRGSAGALVGTIKEITGDIVTIERPEGLVRLSRKAFALGSNGLTLSLTTAELEAAAKAAAQSAQN